jgi:hypothetical protein
MQEDTLLSLNDVVKLTGIPKQTLHARERRYKAVVPTRSDTSFVTQVGTIGSAHAMIGLEPSWPNGGN